MKMKGVKERTQIVMEVDEGLLRATLKGLSQEELALARMAEQDYETWGQAFEERIGALLPEELREASFWVEGNEVHFDCGW